MKLRFFFTFLMMFFLSSKTFSQKSYEKDTDNDGVIDLIDVDDDNDGIFDFQENRKKKYSIKKWKNRENVNYVKNRIIFYSGNFGWRNTINSSRFSTFNYQNNYEISFRAKVAQSSIIGLGLDEKSKDYSDVDYGILFNGFYYTIYKGGKRVSRPRFYRFNDRFRIRYTDKGKVIFYRNKKKVFELFAGKGLDFYMDTSFRGNRWCYFKTTFSNINISSINNSRDFDSDGIKNSKDLDSDGDGCFDVIEAGFNDPDKDGILGEGIPRVNRVGKVLQNGGYKNVDGSYLDSDVKNCDLVKKGITINTKQLPNSTYKLVYGDVEYDNLISGKNDSETFIEFRDTEIDDDVGEVFLTVYATAISSELNLKIIKTSDSFLVEVLQLGNWFKLSTEYYEFIEDEIVFFDRKNKFIFPFDINLINGVEYDKANLLKVKILNSINTEGSVLTIFEPKGGESSLNINNNEFLWDGTDMQDGVYKFKLELQGKIFNGQFVIRN